jgi:hypothetical protein
MSERPEHQGPELGGPVPRGTLPPEPPHDLLDQEQPFDAGQWAMHGLLRTHFDAERGDLDARARQILVRVQAATGAGASDAAGAPAHGDSAAGTTASRLLAAGPAARASRILALLRRPRAWLFGSGLAAAGLVAAGVVIGLRFSEREALARVVTGAVLNPTPVLLDVELLEGDALRDREETIAAAQQQLAELRAEVERLAREGRAEEAKAAAHRVLLPWKDVYRPLYGLARWDEALAEMRAELAYMRPGGNPTGELLDSDWLSVLLLDLGGTLEAMGDYAGAREAYLASIDDRKQRAERGLADRCATEPHVYPVAWRVCTYVNCVMPAYWRMSYLCVVEGNLVEARQHHAAAEQCLRDYFGGVCQAAGVSVAPGASLVKIYEASPPEFRTPISEYTPAQVQAFEQAYNGFVPSSVFVTKLREHLYREARLRRVEHNLAGARQALSEATRVLCSPRHDESRLDFYEPLELARIAIAERDYETGLRHLAQAERHAGPIRLTDPGGNDVSHGPIAVVPLSELQSLKGAALAALNRSPAERERGRRAVEDTIARVARLGESLSTREQTEFRRPWAAWLDLADRMRQ